ncbi:MAG: threonylcarbamoyl-AMP synthase [Candidatus Magasanikbacteria bacterium]|jgi:L-threonylcarbamoyladenylate synthase|nr:threonylcarbamoyl-AMP synthase [Candidatus Magasanikbacteria bacterium]
MEVIPINNIDITQIVAALKEGKTIVYPTETCYGLGADATNEAAVAKLFAIKKRQQEKSMLMLMADEPMVQEYVAWNHQLHDIAQTYWPGPLTLVSNRFDDVPLASGVIAPDNTIALRITAHPLAAEITSALGKPIVSTSANISEHDSAYDIEHVIAMFTDQKEQPDIIIDAGDLPHQSPSTIVKIEEHGLHVIRQGELIIPEQR